MPAGWAICESVNRPAGSLVVEVNGCRVHIEGEADLELLARVCWALKSEC